MSNRANANNANAQQPQQQAASTVVYSKPTTYAAKVMRLSSQKNQYGSYCYALIEHQLPSEAQILGREGRQIFYSPNLKGELNKELTLELALISVPNTKTGEIVNRIVIARSEAERAAQEKFAREVQADSREAREFGISKQELGKSYFAAKYAAKFGGQPVSTEEDASL